MNRQIQMMKYLVMVVRIFKAYVFKDNLTLWIYQLLCIRLIKYLNICIHDLNKSLYTCDTALELLCKLYDSTNCSDQCRYIHDIRYHISRENLLFHKEISTAQNHDQIHQTIKYSGRSIEHTHEHIRIGLDL